MADQPLVHPSPDQRQDALVVTGAAEHRHPASHGTNGDDLPTALAQQRQGTQRQLYWGLVIDSHDLAQHCRVGLHGG